MNYFKNLAELLKSEKLEDQNQYEKLSTTSSINEKKNNGIVWYPVAIRGIENVAVDYINVEIERTTNSDIIHQFRFGAPVAFYTNHDAKNDRIEGVITYQGGNRMKINFRTEELPDWSRDGKLAVELLFDNITYEQMFSALKKAESTENNSLIPILTGKNKPYFDENFHKFEIAKLNPSQNEAVHKILAAKDLAIVHGPPGTGKTTTLVETIKKLKEKGKILFVAPSNAAVDLLAEKLNDEGINVLRIGNPGRVSEKLYNLTLDSKIQNHSYAKQIKTYKKQASEYKNLAHKYKRNFDRAEREQRKALFDEAHKLMKEVENSEKFITDDIIAKTEVFTATLVGSEHYSIRNLEYHAVIIDEAGQSIEPACWIPILKTEKLILAGDHCQLPPTIKSQTAAKNGLENTLFEKLVQMHPEAVSLLEIQYRMNEKIMHHSSNVFYGGKLQAFEKVKNWKIDELPMEFIDTAGCGYDELLEGTAISNPDEADFTIKILENFIENNQIDKSELSIGLISPYKQQVNLLIEKAKDSNILKTVSKRLDINTIDSFQGQERDIICISLVRSNTKNEIGFLSDIRRMNVAMTRAKKKLIIISDSSTICVNEFYKTLVEYTEAIDAYKSAWEFI